MKKLKLTVILILLLPLFSFSQEYWEHVYTTDTNTIMSLKVAENGTIYYGGAKGLFISDDEGQTWDFKYLLNYVWLYSLEFDIDSNLIVGASYKLYNYDIENDSFYFIETPPPLANFIAIFVDSTQIFANSADNQILRYKDDEWKNIDIGNDVGTVYAILKDTNNVIYVGTTGFDYGGGVYRSFDYGDTWEFMGLYHYYIRSLAIDSQNRLYAGAIGHVTTGDGGFFRYNNQTLSWDTLNNNARVQSIYFNEEDSLYVGIYSIGGNAGAWMSPDFGNTWFNISSGLPDPSHESNNVKDITESTEGFLYAIVGDNKSIYKSTDSTVVGLEKPAHSEEFTFQVFPNPFSSQLLIILNDKSYGHCNVSFFNIRGEIVLAKNNVAIANGKLELKVPEELPGGMYLLKVEFEKYTVTKKVIKN